MPRFGSSFMGAAIARSAALQNVHLEAADMEPPSSSHSTALGLAPSSDHDFEDQALEEATFETSTGDSLFMDKPSQASGSAGHHPGDQPSPKRRRAASADDDVDADSSAAVGGGAAAADRAAADQVAQSPVDEDEDVTEDEEAVWSTMVEIDPGFPFEVVWPSLSEAVFRALRSVHATWPDMGWRSRMEMEASLQRSVETEGAGAIARGLKKEQAERVAQKLQGVVAVSVRLDRDGAETARLNAAEGSPRSAAPAADDSERRERARERVRELREAGGGPLATLVFPDMLGHIERDVENDDRWPSHASAIEHALDLMQGRSGALDNLFRRRLRASSERVITVNVERNRLLASALGSVLEVAPEDLRPGRLRVKYMGEEGQDGEGGSGVTRAFLTHAGKQLADPQLGLFLPGIGGFYQLSPAPGFLTPPAKDAGESVRLQPEIWSRLLGRLLGMAVAHECPLGFLLVPSLCKQLLGKEPTFEDLQYVPGLSESGAGWYHSLRRMLANRAPKLVPEDPSLEVMDTSEVDSALMGLEAVMPSKGQQMFESMSNYVGSMAHSPAWWEGAVGVSAVLLREAKTDSQRLLAVAKINEMLSGMAARDPRGGELAGPLRRNLSSLMNAAAALGGESGSSTVVDAIRSLLAEDQIHLSPREERPASFAQSNLKPLRPQSIPSISTWLTAGAKDLTRRSGRFYHEVELGADFSEVADPQLGWLTDNFVEKDYDCSGVGDDIEGWAVDGIRQKRWHNGPLDGAWPRKWRGHDVIGFAIDLDAGRMLFSLNGDWVDSLQMTFEAPHDQGFFPAVSTKGHFVMHIPRKTWQFAAPDSSYEAWAEDGLYMRPVAMPAPLQPPDLDRQSSRVAGPGLDSTGGELTSGNLQAFAEAVTRKALTENLQPYLSVVVGEFRRVVPQSVRQGLSWQTVQDRISGRRLESSEAFVKEWRGKTTYSSCDEENETVSLWWDYVSELPVEELSALFSWCTGFATIPVTAWKFQIKAVEDTGFRQDLNGT
eukprot:TRINITY_DN1779_c0_g3_i1.p1 TRINITY_DN1779_c0_g3~~TRINITY_DN1779_c0_g3_i1.p1  ORF type:complete len:1004 (+),score=229.06 TRINITY_DN1779_c0_g3_i1:16-3027(+)